MNLIHPIFSVEGKRVLLTGAGGGIGIALAKAFTDAGAKVVGTYRTKSDELLRLQEKAHFLAAHCDLSDASAVEQLPDMAEEMLKGQINIIIHNAWAVPESAPYSLQNLRATAAVGLESAYIIYSNIAPRMAKNGGGSIISIASINGIQAFPANPAYTSIKAALRLFTKTVARDFGESGVRANNLCPGYVQTRMTAASHADPVKYKERCDRTILGRWASPEDIAGPCIFLASDASRYITGQDLVVDGGWLAKGL